MPEDENINTGAISCDAGADLYRRWLGGDGTAFDKIIEIYHDALIFFCLRHSEKFCRRRGYSRRRFRRPDRSSEKILFRMLA